MKKQHIQLTETERQELQELLSKGELSARVFKRATARSALDRGETLEAVATTVNVANDTVRAWRNRYREGGIAALPDKPRSGRPPLIDGKLRAQITALACSEAPAGYSQWNLRLLAERIVELEYCDSISHTQVGHILKKTN